AERLRSAGLGMRGWLSPSPGGILFVAGDLDSANIYRVSFDSKSHKVSGDITPITVGAGFSFSPSASQDGRIIAFDVGNNLAANIWRVPIDAATGKTTGEPIRITSGLEQRNTPSPSHDGRRVAYLLSNSKMAEIRIRDVATGKEVRLAEAKEWSNPVLS